MLFDTGINIIEVDEVHTASCGARVAIIYPDDRSPEIKEKLKANILQICAEIAKEVSTKDKTNVPIS